MLRLAEQVSLPCLFEARQLYSPVSSFVGLRSSRDDVVSLLRILNLSLCLISEPDLNHLKVTLGVSSISHSNFTGLPMLLCMSQIFFLKTGGTEICKEKNTKHYYTGNNMTTNLSDISGWIRDGKEGTTNPETT